MSRELTRPQTTRLPTPSQDGPSNAADGIAGSGAFNCGPFEGHEHPNLTDPSGERTTQSISAHLHGHATDPTQLVAARQDTVTRRLETSNQ
ncbi:MAG: hypothetical protein ACOH1Y_09875 [Propionicimonas sp.]